MATIGVEQHTFRTTVFGFEWVGHHWENQNKPLLATHKGDEMSEKKNYHWEGWVGDDLG